MSEREDLGLELDGREGPALPISEERKERLVAAALGEVLVPAPKRRRWLPIAAAVAGLFLAPGAVAAWMVFRPKPEPPRPVPSPRKPVIAAPPVVAPPPAPKQQAVEPKPRPRPKPKRSAPAKPEDLLAKANRLRRRARWRGAERAYLEVDRRFPKSGSAYVALVAAASLRLEHLDDAKGALDLLTRAERAREDGPLDAELLWTRSRAHRRLGDAPLERRALERLLSEHPNAPLVEIARARLAELTP